MSKALLYRPRDRWQIWAAFGAAVLIHLAAVALAQMPAITDLGTSINITEVTGELTEVTIDPPDVSELELPPAPAPRDATFVEDYSTPPSIKRPPSHSVLPIGRPAIAASGRTTSMGAAKAFAISAPRPDYPYEARRRHATGSGIAVLTVDSSSGYVTDVTMAQTTGIAILDSATVSAFRRWRFKAGTVHTVRTPITFELNGPNF